MRPARATPSEAEVIAHLAVVLCGAYGLAALPLVFVAGAARLPRADLLRWWSRMALAVVLAALAARAVS